MEENEKKELEIVSGDGSELDISEVHDHLSAMRPKSKEEYTKKNIVIPNVPQSKEEDNVDDNDDDDLEEDSDEQDEQ